MAVLRTKDARAMDKKTRAEKLKEMRMELVKAQISSSKNRAKIKEIKKAIARILTLNASEKNQTLQTK